MNNKFKTGFLIKKRVLKKDSVNSFFRTFLEICKFYEPYFFEKKNLKKLE